MANKFLEADKNPSNSKFKNGSGVLMTRGLFLETAASKDYILYTLRDDESRGYPSIRRLYLETSDPTEYQFANRYFENWEHWEALCSTDWFQPYLASFRKELSVKLRAEALNSIRETARSSGREAFQANKYLLDGSWDGTNKNSKGRPSKAEISKAAHTIASDRARIEDDFERILGNG